MLSVLLLAGVAAGQPLGTVTVGDVPGTGGQWQMGEVVVAAPAAEVQRWFAEPALWAQRFPDDEWSRDLGRTPDGVQLASFRSKELGRTLTLRMRIRPGLITYQGQGKKLTTQGKIFIEPMGPGRTKVIMQTTGELGGLTGAIASEKMKRKRAIGKLRSDLEAVVRLSNANANAPRRRG